MFTSLGSNYWAVPCGGNYFVHHGSVGEPFLLSGENYSDLINQDLDAETLSELAGLGFHLDDRVELVKQDGESVEIPFIDLKMKRRGQDEVELTNEAPRSPTLSKSIDLVYQSPPPATKKPYFSPASTTSCG